MSGLWSSVEHTPRWWCWWWWWWLFLFFFFFLQVKRWGRLNCHGVGHSVVSQQRPNLPTQTDLCKTAGLLSLWTVTSRLTEVRLTGGLVPFCLRGFWSWKWRSISGNLSQSLVVVLVFVQWLKEWDDGSKQLKWVSLAGCLDLETGREAWSQRSSFILKGISSGSSTSDQYPAMEEQTPGADQNTLDYISHQVLVQNRIHWNISSPEVLSYGSWSLSTSSSTLCLLGFWTSPRSFWPSFDGHCEGLVTTCELHAREGHCLFIPV